MSQSSGPYPGVIAAWKSLASAAMDVRYIGVHLIAYNLLWLITSLPIITLPAATAALYVVVNEMNYRRAVTWRDYLAALRSHFWIGWRWGVLNAAAITLIGLNLWFYAPMNTTPGTLLYTLWLGIGLGWLIIQMYAFPVLLEQEEPRVQLAVRNAMALVLRYPRFTLIHTIIGAIFILIGLVVPYLWLICLVTLIMFVYARAVRYLLTVERGGDPDDI